MTDRGIMPGIPIQVSSLELTIGSLLTKKGKVSLPRSIYCYERYRSRGMLDDPNVLGINVIIGENL
jgi:hypothetical protein